ncbi:hypothetical protein [Scandinavium sp.]|uniref:hypothetical protein n=1 Tax=Scandinavium sp. TaxID=2830653 RepID=UPI0028A08A86|nr:hypothetical protein [Scandinavium sp.]
MYLVNSVSISKWSMRAILLLFVAGMISGCQKNIQPNSDSESLVTVTPVIPPVPRTYPSSTNITEDQSDNTSRANAAKGGVVSNCERELLALSKVNKNVYVQKKAAFDELLRNAAVYTEVREDIGAETRGTMDALYKYKTQKLCNDIAQSVRESLIAKGENFR